MYPSDSIDLQPKSSLDFSSLSCLPGIYNNKLYPHSLYFARLNKSRPFSLRVLTAQCTAEAHQMDLNFSRKKKIQVEPVDEEHSNVHRVSWWAYARAVGTQLSSLSPTACHLPSPLMLLPSLVCQALLLLRALSKTVQVKMNQVGEDYRSAETNTGHCNQVGLRRSHWSNNTTGAASSGGEQHLEQLTFYSGIAAVRRMCVHWQTLLLQTLWTITLLLAL